MCTLKSSSTLTVNLESIVYTGAKHMYMYVRNSTPYSLVHCMCCNVVTCVFECGYTDRQPLPATVWHSADRAKALGRQCMRLYVL